MDLTDGDSEQPDSPLPAPGAVAAGALADDDLANDDLANDDLANDDLANDDLAKDDLANDDLANDDLANDDLAAYALDALDALDGTEVAALHLALSRSPALAPSGTGPQQAETAAGPSGTFLAEAHEVTGVLAELARSAPPAGLRERVLETALRRRPARDRPPVPEGTAGDAVAAFVRTLDELVLVVDRLDETHREVVAPPVPGGGLSAGDLQAGDLSAGDLQAGDLSAGDIVAHLVAIETYFGSILGLWPDELPAEVAADHRLASAATIAELRNFPLADVRARWRRRAEAVRAGVAALGPADLRRRVQLHQLSLSLSTALLTRTFELWTHTEDLCRILSLPPPPLDAGRLHQMTNLAVRSIPLGLLVAGRSCAGRTARIVLTGAGGGTWDQPLGLGDVPGEPDVLLVADAVEFCRLAAQRVTPTALGAFVEGDADLAGDVLTGAGVFSA